jgi:hypothetical protein
MVMKMILSLAIACIIGMLLFATGLFAAKEQGPPGLTFFSSDTAIIATLGLVMATSLLVIAKHLVPTRRERLRAWASGRAVRLLNYMNALAVKLGNAAVRLVPQSHFQTSRVRSFPT